MHASITLSNLGWATPDGRPLFSDLDLTFARERTGLVGRNGVGKSTLLRLIAGDLQPATGTVVVDGRLGVLRQAVGWPAGHVVADLFGVREQLAMTARGEAGEASAEELAAIDWTLEARIATALGQVGLAVPATTPLDDLSGGEVTRASLAALVFDAPDFLLLDEPTNNLDREGRAAVSRLLADWRGGAVVVSHDRELLDAMDAIVDLTPIGATRHAGGYAAYRARKEADLAAARHDLETAERRIAAAGREAQQRQQRQARRLSEGRRKQARGDLPKILLGTLKSRAEETVGRNAMLAERQRQEATDAAAAAREKVEVLAPFTIEVPSSGLHMTQVVINLREVSIGYMTETVLAEDLSLSIVGPRRVAITGSNGSGKSTLLRTLAGELPALGGVVDMEVPFAMLDQRVSLLDPALSVAENFSRLNPGAATTDCRAALARFRFRADAALQRVGSLSGGETLRAGLACVLGVRPPPLLLLDEPTNHLDIGAIEVVEAGLRAYDGALVVVSHDERFLDAIGIEERIDLGGAHRAHATKDG